jgi:hypothetical protein
MFTKHPWTKVYTNWQFLPLKLQNWQNSPWVFKSLNFTIITLVLCMNLQNGTILITFGKLHFQSLKYPKTTQMVL